MEVNTPTFPPGEPEMPVRLTTLILAALALLVAVPALANDGASPRNFELMLDGPDVVVSVDLTNTGEPGDVDVIRGAETLTRIEFDVSAASSTWLVCRDWGYDTDCALSPDECSDCDGDGVNECSDPECDVWGTFEFTDACVPTTQAGDTVWTYTLSEDWYTESLDIAVPRVDDCQPLVEDEVGDDDDSPAVADDAAGGTSCSTSAAAPLNPLALGLLMGGIGLAGVLFDRRR